MAFFKRDINNKNRILEDLDDGLILESTLNPKPKNPVKIPTDKELISNFRFNLVTGPWIAGGAALAWYRNESVRFSDIDIFTANNAQQSNVIRKIESLGGSLAFDTPSAKTYDMRAGDTRERHHVIQVITLRHFDTPQDILDNFDISVCRVVTDGNHFMLGEGTAYDIHHKILRMKTPLNPDAVKRLIKYWCYGYTPTDELLEEINTDPNIKWNFSGQEGDYLNAF